MINKIKIVIISDVVCPWCIIGYKRLEKAILEMELQDKVEIEWQPFELNPNMPSEGEAVPAHRARKYKMSKDEGERSQTHITNMGAELDFMFDFFEDMRVLNTQDAHILLEFAQEFGKQTELKLRLFEAYFSERKNISDRQVLLSELQSIGLDIEESLARLDNPSVRKRILIAETHWHSLGISSVPTMIFNHSKILSGARPIEQYKEVLSELINN